MLFNRDRAIEYMDRYELDALVATSPTNITYFSDYYCWLDKLFKAYMTKPGAGIELTQQFAVFPKTGEPALIVVPLLAANALDSWVHDIRSIGGSGFDDTVPAQLPLTERQTYFLDFAKGLQSDKTAVSSLRDILEDRGLTAGRIGIECDGLPRTTLSEIRERLPKAQIKNASNLILLIRMVKSPEELARLRRAGQIGEEAASRVLANARTGKSLRDMVGEYRSHLGNAGADLDHFAMCIRGLGIATEPDSPLQDDDILYTDYGCVYDYYCSDSGQTLAMRSLSTENRKRYDALRDCVLAGAETARSGAKASSVAAAMSSLLECHGVTGSFPHGHGIGLEIRDYPILVADNGLKIRDDCVDIPSDLSLEAHMVLSLEAGLFTPGAFSFQVECSYVVTDNGAEPLTPQDRTNPVIVGDRR